MERSKEITDELSGICPVLAQYGRTVQPYRIPLGYFEQFTENLLLRIRRKEAEEDIAGPRSSTASPDPHSELKELSPLLAGIDRKTPYRVPEDYFEEFRAKTPADQPPRRALFFLRSRSRVLKYAMAAAVAGIMATAAFFTFHKAPADPLSGLSAVSEQDMASYLENHDVHWTPDGTDTTTAPPEATPFNDNEISDLLSNVSDAELEQYLSDLPPQKQTTN